MFTSVKKLNGIDGTFNNNYIAVLQDGSELIVPMDTDNSDYKEILKQVADGTITIAEAD